MILLIAAGAVCCLVWDNYFNDNKTKEQEGQEQITSEEKKPDDKKVEDDTKRGDSDENDDKKVVQYEGDDPNLNAELTGSVTYAGVLDDRITIRVNIDQYLSGGSCALSLLDKDVVVYNESTGIVNSASTATCEGFDIPVSSVGAGNYEIVIRISSGDKNGLIKGEARV